MSYLDNKRSTSKFIRFESFQKSIVGLSKYRIQKKGKVFQNSSHSMCVHVSWPINAKGGAELKLFPCQKGHWIQSTKKMEMEINIYV